MPLVLYIPSSNVKLVCFSLFVFRYSFFVIRFSLFAFRFSLFVFRFLIFEIGLNIVF